VIQSPAADIPLLTVAEQSFPEAPRIHAKSGPKLVASAVLLDLGRVSVPCGRDVAKRAPVTGLILAIRHDCPGLLKTTNIHCRLRAHCHCFAVDSHNMKHSL
jgi:hypothetical protein